MLVVWGGNANKLLQGARRKVHKGVDYVHRLYMSSKVWFE